MFLGKKATTVQPRGPPIPWAEIAPCASLYESWSRLSYLVIKLHGAPGVAHAGAWHQLSFRLSHFQF